MTAPSASITLELQTASGGCRLVVRGEIDVAAEQTFLAAAVEALDRASTPDLVVDLTEVTFIDSSGLRALLRLNKQASSQDRVVRLAVVPGPVTMLFTVAGVTDRFTYE